MKSSTVRATDAKADFTMLFVIGAARSGTTYAVDILDELFDFGMGPEGHFVLNLARRLRRYGDLQIAYNMERLLSDMRHGSTLSIIRTEWAPEKRFDVSLAQLSARLPEKTFAGAVYAVFRCIADAMGKQHVGTKNPAYTLALPLLEHHFGKRAKFLHVVRDGRDVALSTLKMPWGEKSVYAAASSWALHTRRAIEFQKTVGASRYLTVKYEDLVSKPEKVLDALEMFLGFEIEPARKQDFLQSAGEGGFSGNFLKWKKALAERDRIRFEALAGPELAHFGYEREFASPVVSGLEVAYFESRELMRKIAHTVHGWRR